jgi:hypothetical protein
VCALYLFWIVPRVLAQTSPRPTGRTEARHGAGVRPDYARLFASIRVHEIRITIAAERFRDMQADLRALTTPMPGGRRGFGPPGMNGGDPPALPAGARRGGPINFSVRDPIYVPVTVHHDGHVWTNVGMRYKGNSSLMAASRSGTGAPRPPGAMRGFGARSDDVLHEQVGDRWPLIQRLLADEVYAAKYTEHLERAIGGAFAPTAFAARATTLHAMIAAFVIGDQSEHPSHTTVSSPAAFEQAIDGPVGLLEIAEGRRELIRAALKK